MTLGEKYYDIAMDDLQFVTVARVEGYYNQTTTLCQQIAEKLLKSVVADYYTETDLEDVLRSHSLRRIASAIEKIAGKEYFDKKALAYLSDYYYDVRYPGPDYVKIDKSTFDECFGIMSECKMKVDELLNELKNQ